MATRNDTTRVLIEPVIVKMVPIVGLKLGVTAINLQERKETLKHDILILFKPTFDHKRG